MKIIKKLRNGNLLQLNDGTLVSKPVVTNLPMDDSTESKFYRDLAALSAMTNEERAKEDFYNRAHNTGTIAPTNEEARTGWMEVNPTTGETTWHAPTVKVNNLPGAWEQMAQRAWESPAFQFALAPMFDIPFIFKGLNTKVLPNGIIRNVELNNKIRLSLPSHTATNPRQIVLEPAGAGKYRPHIRIWDGDRVPGVISNSDKQLLYNTMVDLLPYGTELLFPQSGPGYYATRGTVAGLLRLGRDARFIPGSKGILYYTDKDGTIRTFEGTSFIKSPLQIRRTYNLPKISILPVNSTIITGDAPSEISMSPEELYTFLNNLKGYYFYGHGTGRTHVNPEVIFNNGLRIKNGDIANTTIPITEANLASWPHLNSEEIIILPGKVESVKYDAPFGHIPTDWFDSSAFHWTDNPKMVGRGLFARQEPHASFIETTKNGIPGVFTKPEAVLGSYNTRTHTLRFNPNSLYKFLFNQPLLITSENTMSITPMQWTAALDAAIATGDMAEAQRLRDLHFKVAAPNSVTYDVFHHGNTKPMNWFTFDPARVGTTDEGFSGAGYYFAPTRPAGLYSKEHFAHALGPHLEENAGLSGGRYHRYVYLNGETKYKPIREYDWTTHTDFPFVDNRPIEVVVGDNRQIKLADAVTYDDKGIRIPLGERDNFNNPDIRWGLLPWIFGGTTGYKYLNINDSYGKTNN